MKMAARNSGSRILRKSQGAITIFEMIPIIALMVGISCGVALGSKFGPAGTWIGGIAGGVIGLSCWVLFLAFIKWLEENPSVRNKLSGRTTERLRKKLLNPGCKNPNEILLELGIRGEKMENYLPMICELMISPLMERRRRGWLTLVTVFPERAKKISDYQFFESAEKCREKVLKLA